MRRHDAVERADAGGVDWDAVMVELTRCIEDGDEMHLPEQQMPPQYESMARSLLERLDERIGETADAMAEIDGERHRIVASRRSADLDPGPAAERVNFSA